MYIHVHVCITCISECACMHDMHISIHVCAHVYVQYTPKKISRFRSVQRPFYGTGRSGLFPFSSRSVSVQISRSAPFRSIRFFRVPYIIIISHFRLLSQVAGERGLLSLEERMVLDEYKKRRILEYNKQGYSPRRISDKNS